MAQLPKTLEEAIAQSKEATQAALDDGHRLLQVQLVFPEIALQAQSIAQQFIPLFQSYGSGLKVFFPDTGAAALARRDWGEVPFKVSDVGSSRTSPEKKIELEDEAFLVISPSAVEVAQVEKMFNLAGDRPFVLLNPQMEDISIVGIGYSARQMRDRFLNTIESCYYLKPLEGAAILRTYPSLWQVWQEISDGEYQLITEASQRPAGDELDQILSRQPTSTTDETVGKTPAPTPKKAGFLTNLQRFMRALSQ
jgi:hypothetical protein